MGYLTFLRQTVASVANPAAGKSGVFVDSATGQLAVKNDSGASALLAPAPGNLAPAGVATLTGNSAAINTTETIVLSYQIPANSLRVGTTLRVSGFAQGSGTVAGTGTVTIRLGTANTTGGDPAVVVSGNLASTSTAVGIAFDGLVTVRTIGSGGTVLGNIDAGVSGVAHVTSKSTATVTCNTTLANFIDVSVVTTATTCSFIVTNCEIVVDQS